MTDADFMRLAIQAAWQGLGLGESGVQLVGDVLREESLKLFEAWSRGKTRPGT